MQDNTRKGIIIMILTSFVFAAQDGVSRHLAEAYNTELVIMIRYWFSRSLSFGCRLAQPGGLPGCGQNSFSAVANFACDHSCL